jgi:hypothetical protein
MVGRWKGQFPVFISGMDEANKDVSDFRRVPASDTGEGYDDQGQLGGFETNEGRPFDPPSDVQFMAGFGATEADLKRGYVVPGIKEDPAYDKINYADRSSRPKKVDEDVGNTSGLPKDYEFQSRNNTSKGFLVRKRLPTER